MTTLDHKYEFVTWEDVETFIAEVEDYLQDNKITVTGVYGLPRGGLIFAVMLSHVLDTPLLMAPANNCLIVDDICDSGESLLHYINNSSGDRRNQYITATMYMKTNQLVCPDFYYKVKTDSWIVFPWEGIYS